MTQKSKGDGSTVRVSYRGGWWWIGVKVASFCGG